MATKNQNDKDGAVLYQFYGQEPMTLDERAVFLEAARDQEKAYDDYLAKLANRRIVDNLPHEYLPDVDDPQHRFRDPNHPFNLPSEIAHGERVLEGLQQRIQDELNSPFENTRQLKLLEKSYAEQQADLEMKREILSNSNAARNLEKVAMEKSGDVSAVESGVDNNTAWHKKGFVSSDYPLQFTPEFQRAAELNLMNLGASRKQDLPFRPAVFERSAEALYTNSGDAPIETSWHKKATINPYSSTISEDQLMRTAASDRIRYKRDSQAGEVTNNILQQAAEMKHSVQAGDLFSVLPVMGKAFAAHTLAPLGTEALFQADAAKTVLDKAEKDYARGVLTQQQLAIIDNNTKTTAAEASAAALVPEPGLGMDKIVQMGDRKLVSELVQAGLPKQQAEQYEMGSMVESGHRIAALTVDAMANRADVKQVMDADGAVPLSMALNISREQLKQFGAMSATLGGEALKNEVARNPAFERLAHLSPQKIEGLSQMAAAGVDPLVMDHGYITTVSNRPAQLSADSKAAFIQSANYIMQSGDVAFRVPGNRPVELKATVESFAMTYERLAQDGGLSMQDKMALKKSIDMLSEGIGTGKLQGVVEKYQAAHRSPLETNVVEHAMSMQR